MLLSVIIPCYNCEAYILETLNSLFDQERIPDEIICVDDGSKDRTANIIQTAVDKCPCKLILITQSNSGVSAARNAGIAAACGDILLFLDSDDVFSRCFLKCVEEAASQGYDCIYAELTRNREELYSEMTPYCVTHRDKMETMSDFMYRKDQYHTSAFAYNRHLLELYNIRFTCGAKYGEDWEFTSKYIDVCQSFLCVQEKMFFYRRTQNSATNRCSYEWVDSVCAAERVEKFLLERGSACYSCFSSYMKHRAIFSVAHIFSKYAEKELYSRLCREFDVARSMRIIASDPLVKKKVRAIAWSHRISKWLFYYVCLCSGK